MFYEICNKSKGQMKLVLLIKFEVHRKERVRECCMLVSDQTLYYHTYFNFYTIVQSIWLV